MEGSDIPFVGRGGLKLEYALEQTKRSLDGLVCLDIGASTGGTDIIAMVLKKLLPA